MRIAQTPGRGSNPARSELAEPQREFGRFPDSMSQDETRPELFTRDSLDALEFHWSDA